MNLGGVWKNDIFISKMTYINYAWSVLTVKMQDYTYEEKGDYFGLGESFEGLFRGKHILADPYGDVTESQKTKIISVSHLIGGENPKNRRIGIIKDNKIYTPEPDSEYKCQHENANYGREHVYISNNNQTFSDGDVVYYDVVFPKQKNKKLIKYQLTKRYAINVTVV
jgi:hypothetical protein